MIQFIDFDGCDCDCDQMGIKMELWFKHARETE